MYSKALNQFLHPRHFVTPVSGPNWSNDVAKEIRTQATKLTGSDSQSCLCYDIKQIVEASMTKVEPLIGTGVEGAWSRAKGNEKEDKFQETRDFIQFRPSQQIGCLCFSSELLLCRYVVASYHQKMRAALWTKRTRGACESSGKSEWACSRRSVWDNRAFWSSRVSALHPAPAAALRLAHRALPYFFHYFPPSPLILSSFFPPISRPIFDFLAPSSGFHFGPFPQMRSIALARSGSGKNRIEPKERIREQRDGNRKAFLIPYRSTQPIDIFSFPPLFIRIVPHPYIHPQHNPSSLTQIILIY